MLCEHCMLAQPVFRQLRKGGKPAFLRNYLMRLSPQAPAGRQQLPQPHLFWCARWMQLNSFSFLWPAGAYRAGYLRARGQAGWERVR